MAPKSLVLLAAAFLLAAAVGQVRGDLVGTISGVVPCSIGSNINVTAVPPFANATVAMVCGSTMVTTGTTSNTGNINISIGMTGSVLAALLSGQCRMVVVTPLFACNASLAGAIGTLTAPLEVLNSTTTSVGSVLRIVTRLFSLI